MALYQVAICVYSVFLTPVLCGMPIALTQFISKYKGEKNTYDFECGISFSFSVMCFLGIICGFFMFIMRRFFALALKEPNAEYAISALAPSVFLVALGAFFKSCYEGFENMLPCALSQGIESALKLLFACIFTSAFGIFSAKYTALGAALSITFGEAAATFVLFLFFTLSFKKNAYSYKNGKVCRGILSYALPVTVYAIVLNSLHLLETSVIRNSLLAVKFGGISAQRLLLRYSSFTAVFDSVAVTGKLSARGADWLYGAYFGYALTIVRFPAGLLRTFCVPFFPIASKHFAQGNIRKLLTLLAKLTGIMLTVSVPICVLFMTFAPQISSLIFGSRAYAHMLASASPLLIFAPLTELFSAVWYACGKTLPPFVFSFVSSLLSVLLSAILIRVPSLNISGVAVSSVISCLFEFLLLFAFTRRNLIIKASASYRS